MGELREVDDLRAELRKKLARILDVERLLAKVTLGTAGPREVLALGPIAGGDPGLLKRPASNGAVGAAAQTSRPPRRSAGSPRPILEAISDEPPMNLADGGTIRDGYQRRVGRTARPRQNSKQYIAQIEKRERQRTGIGSLKVRFNNVFGYYIEISKANMHLAPADYERKQTLVNAERFTTPELKDYERKILDAEEQILDDREANVPARSRNRPPTHALRIRETAARWPNSTSLRRWRRWRRRTATRGRSSRFGEMRSPAGRHPVIEKLAEREAGRFIPNDLYLNDATDQIAIITGSEHGRQVHISAAGGADRDPGADGFVRARGSAHAADRSIASSRASGRRDNLARGRSTFMVEMTETAVILNTATARSFIVLDEIGRGTATYDGLALAWAVVEHVHAQHARQDAVRHALSRTDGTGRAARRRTQSASGASRRPATKLSSCAKSSRARQIAATGSKSRAWRGCRPAVIERAREVLGLHERTEHVVSRGARAESGKRVQCRSGCSSPVRYEIAEDSRPQNR